MAVVPARILHDAPETGLCLRIGHPAQRVPHQAFHGQARIPSVVAWGIALREAEQERWKLDQDQIEGRVQEIRRTLETFNLRLAAVTFDIVGIGIPRSLDYSSNVDPSELAERLCPTITGYRKRLEDALPEEICDDLGKMGWLLADLSFATGVLAGAMFTGASEQEVNRLERGILHATLSKRETVAN